MEIIGKFFIHMMEDPDEKHVAEEMYKAGYRFIITLDERKYPLYYMTHDVTVITLKAFSRYTEAEAYQLVP